MGELSIPNEILALIFLKFNKISEEKKNFICDSVVRTFLRNLMLHLGKGYKGLYNIEKAFLSLLSDPPISKISNSYC